MLRPFLTLVIALGVLCSPLMAASPVGKIISVKGDAFIAHLLKKSKKAVVGEDVFEKDKIKTKKDGEVVIEMFGESKITVGPSSYMKIPKKTVGKKSATKLALFSGKVGFKVNKLSSKQSFTIKTPSAVAGVRGTDGVSSYDANTGVTGVQSLPHESGGNPSVVWTAPPHMEKQLNQAISESRAAEEQGPAAGNNPAGAGGPPPAPEGVIVVNEGQAGIIMPDGTSVVVEMKPGQSLQNMAQQVAQNIKNGDLNTFLKDKAIQNTELSDEQLELLERRATESLINSSVDAARAIPELPAPASTPE